MKDPSLPRLVLFSGLGLDHTLYAPQQRLPARIETVPWLPPRPDETLRTYAHRLAQTIDPAPAPFLGGVSFGAMLAIEAAAVLRPRGVFNIAGARSGRAVSPLVKLTCTLAPAMSDAMIKSAFDAAGLLIRMTGRADRRQRTFLLDVARRADPALTRWGCGALLPWRAPQSIHCPIHHIHGRDDRMIHFDRVRRDVDVVIPGGGHIINVTHASEVNRFIAERLLR